MKQSPGKTFLTYVWITLASVVYAFGFNWCYAPNHIGFGGITGVGQIINAILPWAPIGTVVIILNIPLFILGWKFIGGHLLVTSLFAMFVSSAAIDALNAIYTFQPMDPMLATIYGGVLMGLSLGVVFLQGATTGGTDLIARLLKLKMAWLPMGKLLMVIDLVVILAVAAAFGNVDSALYGVVALYISSMVMDMVLYGLDTAKVAYIISPGAGPGPGRYHPPRRGCLVRSGKASAHVRLQAAADRHDEAAGEGAGPRRLPHRMRCP